MNDRNDDPARRTGNERTRATDTVATITEELLEDLEAMKVEVGGLLDDGREHEVKHALLNRVAALQGAMNLLGKRMDSCDYEAQCPLRDVINHFKKPSENP